MKICFAFLTFICVSGIHINCLFRRKPVHFVKTNKLNDRQYPISRVLSDESENVLKTKYTHLENLMTKVKDEVTEKIENEISNNYVSNVLEKNLQNVIFSTLINSPFYKSDDYDINNNQDYSDLEKKINLLLKTQEGILQLNLKGMLKRVFKLIEAEKILKTKCMSSKKYEEPKTYINEKEINNTNTEKNVKLQQLILLQKYEKCKFNEEKNDKDETMKCAFANDEQDRNLQEDELSEKYKTDVYDYYVSLEREIKEEHLRTKVKDLYDKYVFMPIKKEKSINYTDMFLHDDFLNALKIVIFKSYRENEKEVLESFVTVIQHLFKIITDKKTSEQMFSFVKTFFSNVSFMFRKTLTIFDTLKPYIEIQMKELKKVTLDNIKNVLTKICVQYSIQYIDYMNIVHSDYKNKIVKSGFPVHVNIMGRVIPESNDLNKNLTNTNFLSISSELTNEDVYGIVLLEKENDDGDDEILCKYLPIKKKNFYSKLNLVKNIAIEVSLAYLINLLLKNGMEHIENRLQKHF